MGKNSGAANYKLPEVNTLLDLIKDQLPLGKDDWERVANIYNSTRLSGWAERDADSIKRKFRQLYLTWKPTGTATIPAHIELAKEVKEAIDSKAGVVDLDDGGDVDEPCENVSVAPATGVRSDFDDLEDAARVWSTCLTARNDEEESQSDSLVSSTISGLAVFGQSDEAARTTRRLNRDELEAARYPNLATASDRLGGGDLIQYREEGRYKRHADDDVPPEASFAKQKKVRAEKALTTLKKDLALRQDAGTKGANDIFQLMLLLREESERKAEARRVEEELRRRDDQLEKEAKRREEKEEKEARRRDEREEREERRRQDKQDAEDRARARTQEMMLLISAFTKNVKVLEGLVVGTWTEDGKLQSD